MADKINGTADWAPGTLDKTRKNIGEISDKDAADMAKKLGGEVLYERSVNSSAASSNRAGRIVRQAPGSSGGSAGRPGGSGVGGAGGMAGGSTARRRKEDLPVIPKKAAATMDKLMMSPEFKIKPNYGMFNFIRSFQKNGLEKSTGLF